MNPKRPFALARAARLAAAAVVALGLLILTLSRPRVHQDARADATALAARADASNAPSARALLTALRSAAPHGDVVRIITTDERSYGQPLKTGLWTTAVTALGHRLAAVADIEVSQPGTLGAGYSLERDAAIVTGVIALLGLVVLNARDRGFAGRKPDTHRRDAAPRAPEPHVQPTATNDDRRPLVSALMVVIDTLPESPAGARALRTLKQVGVETIEPKPGAAFDSRLHCVCGVVDAPDPTVVDRVAAVMRPGYIDHGLVLREADVQIYGATRSKAHARPAVS